MLFHTVGKMQGKESPDEICAKHPFLDPRTWDSWEELDRKEGGRVRRHPQVQPLILTQGNP